jgi:hypothetical protein
MPLEDKIAKLESFEKSIINTSLQTLDTMIKYLDIPADI